VLSSLGTGTVTLQNLSHFTGGNALGDGGGLLSMSAVTVTNSDISGNHAHSPNLVCTTSTPATCSGSGDGGGIAVDPGLISEVSNGDLSLDHSTLSGNTADDSGGGALVVGSVTSSNSTVSGNKAGTDEGTCYDGCSGGGIYTVGGIADTGSTFSSNQAGFCEECWADGGGIYTGGETSFVGSTITGNSTTCIDFCDGDGGGLLKGRGWLDSADVKGPTRAQSADRPTAQGTDPTNLSFTDTTVSDNHVSCEDPSVCDVSGGGFAAFDTPTIDVIRSTFSNNSAQWDGGAFDVFNSAPDGDTDVRVENSTITGNSSGVDGAMDVSNGDEFAINLTLVYDTIVGNVATGAPVAESTVTAQAGVHATIVEQPADLSVNSGDLTLFGTILALPQGGPNCVLFEGANVVTQGYNWTDDTSCIPTPAATDKVSSPNDPQLNALGAWGGPTNTMLPDTPLHGGVASPVIDAIPASACQTGAAAGVTTDQRGVTRPQLVGCDIGAVEVTQADYMVEAAVVTPKFTG
jgi:hypothetical protein